MSVGAVAAFVAAFTFESTLLGVASAIVAGVLISLIYAVITVHLMANHVATGLAVAIFGVGLAAFLGKPFEAKVLPSIAPTEVPWLSELPVIGPALFAQPWMVYVTWLLFGWWCGFYRAPVAVLY